MSSLKRPDLLQRLYRNVSRQVTSHTSTRQQQKTLRQNDDITASEFESSAGAGNVTRTEERAPVVVKVTGKHMVLEGNDRALVNFTSNDLFGLQHHQDVQDSELHGVSVRCLSTQYKSYYKSMAGQKQVEDKLSLLHRKQDTVSVMASFSTTLHTWLGEVAGSSDVAVYSDSRCHLVDARFSSQKFSNQEDLEQLLLHDSSQQRTAEKQTQLVVVSLTDCPHSLQYIRSVSETAERHQATVVLLDPHGVILLKHLLGESVSVLNTLQSPCVIQSSLDLLHGLDSLTYISGPSTLTQWFRQVLPPSTQTVAPSLVARTLKALEILPGQSHKVYNVLMQNLRLKRALQSEGLMVEGVMDLTLFLDRRSCERTVRDLRGEGHHVSTVNSEGHTGIRICLTTEHQEKDVQNLQEAIMTSLKSQLIITSRCLRHTNKAVSNKHSSQNSTAVKTSDQKQQRNKLQANGYASLREIITGAKKDAGCQGDDTESDVTERIHSSRGQKINPQHLHRDLQWLKHLYCSPTFDEQLAESLSFLNLW